MERRESLKYIILGTMASSMTLQGCKTEESGKVAKIAPKENYNYGRTPEEKELIKELQSEQFFNEHEMETITAVCALILPPTAEYGGAVEAAAPDFIEFMSKDYPPFQVPLRGGLMWLDQESNELFGVEFKKATEDQQKQILDTIAYLPDEGEPSLGENFFSLMRNLTLTGYYTSPEGIKDLGYIGNTPNVWDGVPEEVLIQHGVAYEEEWLAKCIDQSKRGITAEWDAEGNLIS
ncbi:MAG: gluconate 2-dehydrogenase subunit 3 family protein [Flavobacteriaceae bacterium]|nr:gluconate 2-dehydrogenase subunit 3 family protein [Flavobacteriaceae bacterium]